MDYHELEVELLARRRKVAQLATPVVALAPLESRGGARVPGAQRGVLPDGAEVGAEGQAVVDGDGDGGLGSGGSRRGRRSED